ncbi:MAG: RDD family protein [Bdellovibrionales bacterium]|nr:RDD family protein [Bdellovibrionales bacterium]
MVLEDSFIYDKSHNKNNINTENEHFHLADPLDRAGAFIVDTFIILLPILMLTNAPFKRLMFSSVLLDNNFNFAISIVLGTLFSVFIIIFYNTITTWLLGASLGKRFFGLKVVDIWTKKKPNFTTSLLRSFAWWLGVFTFGFAFSSIFTNTRRRALHDRISETIVASEKYKAIGKPSLYESSIVKGVFAGFLGFICLIISIVLIDTQKNLSKTNDIADSLEQKGGLCSAIGAAYREWPESAESSLTRIQVAMSLYAAGNINEDCLEAEASFVFRQEIESPLAYLAKSFVYSDRAKLSDSYLQRVCELSKDSKDCVMSKIVKYWDEEDWEKINIEFQKVDETWPIYIQIWSIRNSINQGDADYAMNRLKDIPDIESLKSFKIIFKTKAYALEKQNDSINQISDLALSSLNESEKLNLSTWLCYQQATQSCEAFKTDSCKFMTTNTDKSLMENSIFALTKTRENYCKGGYLREFHNVNREVQKINLALQEAERNTQKSLEMLWSIYENKKYQLKVREEAARYFLEKADAPELLDKFVILWKSSPHELEWQKTGTLLFEKLKNLQLFEKASEVGQFVLEYNDNNKDFKNSLALALFKSGNNQKAWSLISNEVTYENERTPASVGDEFEFMKKTLKKEFFKK